VIGVVSPSGVMDKFLLNVGFLNAGGKLVADSGRLVVASGRCVVGLQRSIAQAGTSHAFAIR
jgi:hypothetical protein